MLKYLAKRLIMMLPTLFGVTILSFIIINLAPGSPLEQKNNELKFVGQSMSAQSQSDSNNAGVSKEVIEQLKKQYGFDKPLLTRYWIWLKNIATLDFGESFKYEEPVTALIVSKMPVSLQFGFVSFILVYLISIPLGIAKAVRDGTRFDSVSSFILFVLYSIPALMLGILLIVFFAGGSFMDLFPIQGLVSDYYDELGFFDKIADRVHHFVLPLITYMVGSFTVLTLLMKNSLLDEIKLDYVRTARAKGLDERTFVYKHALRNALIPIATGMGSFMGIFFAGSIIIESIFGLDGMGLLSYKAALDRDYNVIMGLIFIQSLFMLVGRLISDFLYVIIDPRIDFS